MIDWNSGYDKKDLQVDVGHIIAKSPSIETLKSICKYNPETGEKDTPVFELDTLTIELKDEDLYDKDNMLVKAGETTVDKAMIIKVMEEIFNKKLLIKDETRVLKKEMGNSYTITIQKPTNYKAPLLVMAKNMNYIIAPRYEEN